MTLPENVVPSTRLQPGPSPAVLGWISLAMVVAGVAASAALGGTIPSPFGDPSAITAYFAGQSSAVLVSAVLQFAAAVPLAIYAAVASSRLRHLGVTAPGATIALVGGIVAAVGMTIAGLLTWVLAQPGVGSAGGTLVLALHDLTFATGGVGTVVFLGLLVAGIAVPALMTGLLPRWLAIAGLVIAAIAVLSTLSLAWSGLAILLPIGRFPGMIWLIVAGHLLPRSRR